MDCSYLLQVLCTKLSEQLYSYRAPIDRDSMLLQAKMMTSPSLYDFYRISYCVLYN